MNEAPYAHNPENLQDYIRLCRMFIQLGEEPDKESIKEEIAGLQNEITAREALTENIFFPVPLLCETLCLAGAERFCAILGICCAIDGNLSNKILEISGSATPSFDLALSLYGEYCREARTPALLTLIDDDNSPLRYIFEPIRGGDLPRALFKPLLPRKNIMYFIASGVIGNRQCYRISYPNGDGYMPLHEDVYNEFLKAVQKLFSDKLPLLLFLTGPAGSGKHSVAERIAATAGKPLVSFELDAAASIGNPSNMYEELVLDTVLCGGILCVRRYTAGQELLLRRILRALPNNIPVVLHSDIEGCPAPSIYGRIILHRIIGALEGEDYNAAFHELRKRLNFSGENLPGYYRLTIGQMGRVLADARALCAETGRDSVEQRDFTRALRALGGVTKAHVIESAAVFEDLVAAPETTERIRSVCALARGWRGVSNRYEEAGTLPYGKGVTALFYGPSGTGKTLAASVIANELGLELWHIDLSAILDKYIGETEKHLTEVFASAKKRNCILFFDEADALFSRRTIVSTANDRYANVETSFLLRCVEDYDGVVLLATNLYQNIDTAFLRRLSIIVRFALPDKSLRLALWERAFPENIPLDETVDLPLLAAELELTPAEIRAAAQTAAVLAEGKSVSPFHLLYALEIEMEKSGRSVVLGELKGFFDMSSKL